jgi:hypothetical protein
MTQNIHSESNRIIAGYIAKKEEEKTLSLSQVKSAIQNQLQAEKQMGADEAQMTLLTAVMGDLEHLLSGRYIVGGVRM